jgi:hypothetical protein
VYKKRDGIAEKFLRNSGLDLKKEDSLEDLTINVRIIWKGILNIGIKRI